MSDTPDLNTKPNVNKGEFTRQCVCSGARCVYTRDGGCAYLRFTGQTFNPYAKS